jgi:MacB-like periplasmic core domain
VVGQPSARHDGLRWPESLPLDVTPHPRILGFTLLASLVSAMIFGTVPALHAARIEPDSALKGGKGSTQTRWQSLLGRTLVVAQVALALLLLVGAGLFVRTLVNLQNVPTGFNQQNVMLFRLDTATTGYKGPRLVQLLREVEDHVKTVPSVQTASFSFLIFNQRQWTTRLFTRDQTQTGGQSHVVRQNVVGRDYFATMGIPLVLGRSFGPHDTEKCHKVALISETMAERFFPNSSPLGRRFGSGGLENSEQIEIIGVVKDARYGNLTEELRPMVYYPFPGQRAP